MALGASGNLYVQSEAVLREQYASLARQVPLMYALMFLNVLFLALVTADGGSWAVSFVAPLALTGIIAVRAAAWYARRGAVTRSEERRVGKEWGVRVRFRGWPDHKKKKKKKS